MRACGCGWNRRCGTAERDYKHSEKKRFGEPERAISEARCSPGADDCSGQKAEADQAEDEGLGETLFADLRSGVWGERVVEAFRCITKVAGDERRVVGEAVDAAEAGNLKGGDIGDDAGECHFGEAGGEPAQDKDSHDLQCQGEEGGANADAGAEVFGGQNAGEEAC